MIKNYDYKKIGEFIKSIPKKLVQKENEKQLIETQKDYIEFTSDLKKNKCSFCKKHLKYIDKNLPCLHWLLRPKGVDKKRLVNALEVPTWSFFQLQSISDGLQITKNHLLG